MKLYASENENLQLKQNKQCELVLVERKPRIKLTLKELHTPIDSHRINVYSLEQHDKELLQEFCISLLKDIDYSNYEEKLFIDDYLEPRIKNLLKERGVE